MSIVSCIGKLGGAPNALGSKNPPAYYASPIWITRKGIAKQFRHLLRCLGVSLWFTAGLERCCRLKRLRSPAQ